MENKQKTVEKEFSKAQWIEAYAWQNEQAEKGAIKILSTYEHGIIKKIAVFEE